MKSENVGQKSPYVKKSDDQKSSKEERMRGKTTEGLQEQRVKVDKSHFFLKVTFAWLDFNLELWEDSSQKKTNC